MKYQPVLTDSEYRVLVVTPERKHLIWLSEGECDGQLFTAVHNLPPDQLSQLTSEPWAWCYKPSKQVDNLERNDNYSQEHKMRSLFLRDKLITYYDITNRINFARVKTSPLLDSQSLVYEEKYRQARLFVDSGYSDSVLHDIPMVLDYADLDSCDARQAANQIVLKHQMMMDHLARTERLRIKFLRELREINTAESLTALKEKMHKEIWLNVLL